MDYEIQQSVKLSNEQRDCYAWGSNRKSSDHQML